MHGFRIARVKLILVADGWGSITRASYKTKNYLMKGGVKPLSGGPEIH
jgi:hypothetical protein